MEQKETSAYKSNVSGVAGESATLPLTAGYVEAKQDITLGLMGLSGAQTVIGEGIPMQFKITHKTPTPETLVEVQGVGVKTENLFDVTTILNYWKAGYTVQGSTITVNNLGNAYTNPYKLVDTPMTLYLSCSIKDITSTNARVSLGLLQDDGTFITKASYNADTTGILTQTNVNAVRLDWSKGNTFTITDLIITTDSATTSYEPYGYKIPVTANGKNLFDKVDVVDELITETGGLSTSSYTESSNFIKVVSGKEYALTFFNGSSSSMSRIKRIHAYNSNKEWISQLNTNDVPINTKYTFVLTIPSECCYIRFTLGKTDTDIQLELGSTATSYEPYHAPATTNIYLDKPLYKIGDYADYIDFENKRVTRNIGSVTLNGTESTLLDSGNWRPYEGSFAFAIKYFSNVGYNANSAKAFVMSNLLLGVPYDSIYIGRVVNAISGYIDNQLDFLLRLSNDIASNITEAKQWLSNAQPKVYYPLAIPTTETADLSALPVFEGTTIYTVDGLEPSDMYGKK